MPGIQKIRIFLLTSLVIVFLFLPWAYAQTGPDRRVEIPSSPNPVGSGARAIGMGGAFIAVADEATAASWNPGGIVQQDKPEISFVYDYTKKKKKIGFENHPEASSEGTLGSHGINFLSAVLPYEIQGVSMVFALNYQHLYDFNRDWEYNWEQSQHGFSGLEKREYEQEGGLYALGLTYAARINRFFSIGATLNYWGDVLYENKWEQTYRANGDMSNPLNADEPFKGKGFQRDEFSLEGWNANIGFLWRISEQWTLGGVFKTPFTADLDYESRFISKVENESGSFVYSEWEDVFSYDEKLRFPMSYGIGIAFRASDEFTVSVDIFRTHWDDYEFEDEQGDKTSPISGKDMDDSDVDPTIWLRLGAEYLIIQDTYVIPLRAGLFYDPAPAEGSPDDYYGFSLGGGVAFEYLALDIAYQFRTGNDVGGSMFEEVNFSMDVTEHKVYSSLIIYF